MDGGQPTRIAAVVAALLGGCYEVHFRDDGVDAAGQDAGVVCPPLGGYIRCSDECWTGGAFERRCPVDSYCAPELGLCFPPVERAAGAIRDLDCRVDLDDSLAQYCWNGQPCGTYEHRDPRYRGDGGWCVDESLCEIAPGAGLALECRWSDGSVRNSGPPSLITCPPDPDMRLPFCGGPCGECPLVAGRPLATEAWPQSCIGISDARPFGVCVIAADDVCGPGRGTAGESAGVPFESPDLVGSEYACLLFRDVGSATGLADYGWATLARSCRQYRERFPDAVECLGDDDRPLP